MKEINLTLPLPPSVNTAYAGKEIRHKSKAYKEWIDLAHIAASTQSKYKIKGDEWLGVEYKYFMPIYCKNGNKKVVDVCNYEKVLSDVLAGGKNNPPIIEGFRDHMIKTIILSKHESDRREVEITIRELPNLI